MLGRFLELALVTPDTGDDWQRLQRLGFEPAPTGDIWSHAYGVVACEGLAIGLHARAEDSPSVVFVRPEVAALHRELTALDVPVENARLGSDVFNELTLREPGGVALRVLEARSFSPPARLPARSCLGTFRGLSLPARDMDDALRFWTTLGASCAPAPEPLAGFTVGERLRCHERRLCSGPLLLFEGPDRDAGERLEAAGFPLRPRLAGLADVAHRVARGPDDITLLMLDGRASDAG